MNKKYHVERREFLNKFTDMRAYVIGIVEDTPANNIRAATRRKNAAR